MKDAEHAPAQFLKLLDIAERQKHVIEQWRRAQALGPTDDQLWEAELEKITAEFHGLMLKGVTDDQFQEFSEALAFKVNAKQIDR
jgi:predicted translin family RNA/ssDNA-binding protein